MTVPADDVGGSQAVIASLRAERDAALAVQAALAEVMQAMSRSSFDLSQILESILENATRLCRAKHGSIFRRDDEIYRWAAGRGLEPAYRDIEMATVIQPGPETVVGRAAMSCKAVQIADAWNDADYLPKDEARLGQARTMLGVPLLRDGVPIAVVAMARTDVEPFSEREIALVTTFADQAAIAMENARLLMEQREALEQQTALAEVLEVINASLDDPRSVFEMILNKAHALCGIEIGSLSEFDGVNFCKLARHNYPVGADDLLGQPYPAEPYHAPLLRGETINVADVRSHDFGVHSDRVRDHYIGGGLLAWVEVPMWKDGRLMGTISGWRREARAFSEREVSLLQSFADQAVIAMQNARLLDELRVKTDALALRNSEYGERIDQQAATIDVLRVMAASPGNPSPAFALMTRRARELCNCQSVGIFEYDGSLVHMRTYDGTIPADKIAAYQAMFPMAPDRKSVACRTILDGRTIHVRDLDAEPDLFPIVRQLGVRTILSMPLISAGRVVGAFNLNSNSVDGFSDSQIQLMSTFAEQAVIAISSAETYRTLQERTEALARRNSEYGERIEQQAAMIEVLEAISTSAGDDQPVLELITRRARQLCEAETTGVFSFDGSLISFRCWDTSEPEKLEPYIRTFPRPPSRDLTIGRAILDRQIIEINDADDDPNLAAVAHAHGNRSIITLPFIVSGQVAGGMSIGVRKPGGLTEPQKALARILAEQASIAIGAAGTMRQLKDQTAALTQTVAELQALEEVSRAVNSSLDLDTVLATIISRAVQLSNADQGTIYEFDRTEQVFVPKAAFGMTVANVEALRDRRIRIGETPLGISAATRAPLHIPDLSQRLDIDGSQELVAMGIHALLAVPLVREDEVVGGLVIRRHSVGGFASSIPTLLRTFAGQCVLAIENARLFQDAREARAAAEATLTDLRRAQDRLVQSEKMASLGQLTAGIAHEIKNPLNFVNNFSDLSRDLLDELNEAVAANQSSEVADLTVTLKGNLEKIAQHGRRADSIVKNMLLHSRTGPSEHRATDLNAVVEEALNLAYHGARAETPGFNITLQRELDSAAGLVELYPQEFTRVMVNLINNGFYAAGKRAGEPGFEPTLRVSTRDRGADVEIRVRDNGVGIDTRVRGRIFEPFFTTKPAGEGTGLGLSLSYDIIVKQHGGRLIVDSEIKVFTEFVITLPRTLAADGGDRP